MTNRAESDAQVVLGVGLAVAEPVGSSHGEVGLWQVEELIERSFQYAVRVDVDDALPVLELEDVQFGERELPGA